MIYLKAFIGLLATFHDLKPALVDLNVGCEYILPK
jgi:hypothetical protein